MALEFDLNTVPMKEVAEEFEQQTDSPDEVVVSQPISENTKNYTSSDEVINQAIGDEELKPEEEMCFGTIEYVRAFHCNKDGYHTSRVKAPKRRKIVASINYKACCYVALDKMIGQWRISRVKVSHLHPLNLKLSGMFSANRQLSMHVKDLIQQNNQALANDVGGLANLTFTEKDVRHAVWVFHRCQPPWDVYTFGCALLQNEEICAFQWLFRTWVKCMEKAPMRSALETILPNTRHRWCIWHILKKISHKLISYRRFNQLNTCMKRIVFESKSKNSFERDWHDFIEEYDLYNSRWLNDSIDSRYVC
ncbi:hypothetical protein Ahy_B05g078234 [Arachis hypogaea]|uniref:MULE transposase domain-containing protein n=1 Tax=Arachis hypogaea TaxID=3818 RepID=A0A444Z6N2_ARAHY|nr:hypothetical protein Ahy_B05g078234 [Arachis hypogaea]